MMLCCRLLQINLTAPHTLDFVEKIGANLISRWSFHNIITTSRLELAQCLKSFVEFSFLFSSFHISCFLLIALLIRQYIVLVILAFCFIFIFFFLFFHRFYLFFSVNNSDVIYVGVNKCICVKQSHSY